jgi:hypothetical protein
MPTQAAVGWTSLVLSAIGLYVVVGFLNADAD